MKHGLYILVLGLLGIAAITSCNKDACKDVTCVHGTKENKGGGCTCTCDTNYLGKYCDTLQDRLRYKFLGANGDTTAWRCTDSCGDNRYNAAYSCTFIGDTASHGIWMLNFRNYGRTDTLPLQVVATDFGFIGEVDFGNNAVVNLLGRINANGDSINVTYYYGVNTVTDSCHGTWIKQ